MDLYKTLEDREHLSKTIKYNTDELIKLKALIDAMDKVSFPGMSDRGEHGLFISFVKSIKARVRSYSQGWTDEKFIEVPIELYDGIKDLAKEKIQQREDHIKNLLTENDHD